MDGIYAQPGTVMLEAHTRLGDTPLYRVVWLDPQDHVHSTPASLLWGEAHILADKLEHGEPYVAPVVH